MNVQRFIGKDNNEAMSKVKKELGSEAVILHTRKVRAKGIKGFFSKPLVEVVAAIEEPLVDSEAKPKAGDGERLLAEIKAIASEHPSAQSKQTATKRSFASQAQATVNNGEFRELKSEIAELKSMLSKVSFKNENFRQDSPFYQNKYIQNLANHGVDDEILSALENSFAEQKIDYHDEVQVADFLAGEIKALVGLSFDAENSLDKQKIYYFVGPTGVGKTTTIAKIAAKLALIDKKKVSLITADTYRIAAVDQLKTYGEILSIPLDVVYEADDLDEVLAGKADCDYILIDTAGRNHKDEAMRADLEELLAKTSRHEVFLVMSCTSSTKDIKRIIKSYQFIPEYHLIFTKLDEAESHGNLLNGRYFSKKNLAYLTYGQSVPDDIEPATAERVLSLLMEDISE